MTVDTANCCHFLKTHYQTSLPNLYDSSDVMETQAESRKIDF